MNALVVWRGYSWKNKKDKNQQKWGTDSNEEKEGNVNAKEKAEEKAEKKASKKTSKKEETPMIQNQAASTTMGDIDALAALKEQLEGKK